MDDAWMDTTLFTDYANIRTPLVRENGTFPISPDLLFVPWENFAKRAVPRYDAETLRIDVIMYKITEASHADGMIRAVKRGVPVRLIVEPSWYRDKSNVWQAYQVASMRPASRFGSVPIWDSPIRKPCCSTGRR